MPPILIQRKDVQLRYASNPGPKKKAVQSRYATNPEPKKKGMTSSHNVLLYYTGKEVNIMLLQCVKEQLD